MFCLLLSLIITASGAPRSGPAASLQGRRGPLSKHAQSAPSLSKDPFALLEFKLHSDRDTSIFLPAVPITQHIPAGQ